MAALAQGSLPGCREVVASASFSFSADCVRNCSTFRRSSTFAHGLSSARRQALVALRSSSTSPRRAGAGVGAGRRVGAVACVRWRGLPPSRDRGRDWRANCTPLSVPTENPGSDDTPSTSADSEEGAPMRKSRFRLVQALLGFMAGLSKRLSPMGLARAVWGFLRGRWPQLLLWSIVGSTLGLGLLCSRLTGAAAPRLVAYSDLVDHLQTRTVTTALFEEGSSNVFFNVADESAPVAGAGAPAWQYTARRVRNDETFLLTAMRDAGVKYSSAPQSMSASLKAVLITVVTLWIPLSPLLWLLHRQLAQTGASSQRRKKSVSRPVKFDDVAGVDLARAELMEIVSCMKGASQFASLGAKLPKGVLLVGPPGTGKTLLARAVAGEAGVPFFAASASEFVEMFVGRGAARIRELFAEARKSTPSIVFIDELDAVGGRRGRSFNDERDQTLNQLLTEMDGFDSDSGVLVLAATNRPEALDPALCRPGRLSRRVHVTEPDQLGRQQVLAVHMRGIPVLEDRALLERAVAALTPGFVGADLANLVNEAALLAARKGNSSVSLEDFREAVDRAKYGVGERRRNVFDEMEQKLGSWFNRARSDSPGYPALPASG
ncbi:hypothetical protein MPTK1_5g02750 [Marchantia polymorpha subsp. ruderalis]|nr:hypothetical protein MARPO_0124s0048 [Marchantia polymorpha]BBN10342.1 hypothetical protein Mp_5g02750 [Marchantia polymorpha subsp. ruderalis]|eukprot:PTQ30476.1 hypothetical protein MARPO_0124s0048 [Marchantia polymorpha]